MKDTISNLKFVALAFVALSIVNCSKGSSSPAAADPSTSCPANQLYTTGAGCLPTCGASMVYYNNQCVAASSVIAGSTAAPGQTCNPTYSGGVMGCGPTSTNPGSGFPGSTYPGGGGGGGYGTNPQVCTGRCYPGQVQTLDGNCLPQGQCGTCYGQANGTCLAGAYACYYYYGMQGTSCLH